MRCLDDCHTYIMNSFLGKTPGSEMHKDLIEGLEWQNVLHFYEMRKDGTKIDGVTNEEVLRVLIHRLKFLNEQWMDGKFRCGENIAAIADLEDALFWLEKRTTDRIARNVEGTHQP